MSGGNISDGDEGSRAAWSVTAICFVMAVFAWGGVFYGHSVYLEFLQARHGWSTSLISAAIFATYLTAIPATILVGNLLDRINPAWCVVAGGLSIGFAIILIGLIQAPWQLFVAFAMLGAGYPALAGPAIAIILARWFTRRFGLALSLALTGASVGGALMPPVLVFLSAGEGFAFATSLIGSITVATVLVLGLWMHRLNTRRARGLGADGADKNPRQRRDILRQAAFWTIAAGSALGLCGQVGFLAHQIPILSQHVSSQSASLMVTATVLSAIVGRFAAGLLLIRMPLFPLAAGCYLVQAAGFAIVNLASGLIALIAGCLIAGFVVGAIVMMPPLLVRYAFGNQSYGRIFGMCGIAAYFGGGLGPWLVGVGHDGFAGYGTPLWGLVAVQVGAAAVMLFGRRRSGTRAHL